MRPVLNLTELITPIGFQRRTNFMRVSKGVRLRHCYGCNGIIPKNMPHVNIDSHLSSGYRSNINICSDCMTKLYVQLKES